MNTISQTQWIGKMRAFATAHKFSSAIIVIAVVGVAFFAYRKIFPAAAQTRYVLATVQKGTLISSVTGSGQVSTSNQIDLKPKASGEVVSISVTEGQVVKAGALIASLDATDALKAVRDAQANLESAQLSLQKLKQPADTLSLIQAQNSLDQANESLAKAHDDGFTAVSNTFLDLPGVMAGLQDVLYGTALTKGGQDNISAYADMVKNFDENVSIYKDSAATNYASARAAYDKTFADYKASTRFDDPQSIEKLVNETYETTKTVAEAVKSANDLINFVKDQLTLHSQTAPALLATHLSQLATYTGGTNTDLSSLNNIKDSITSTNRTIAETTASLAKLKSGADPLDITSSELAVTQRQNALTDAQNALANYAVRAPFDGTITKINVKKFDTASAGTAVATLITQQKIAELSVNEVDAAKIKTGEKVTLTFDAIDGLSLTGEVAEVDTVGTVTQGVVTYAVKISFDSQDERVKSGMSVNAAIITDIKQDVLMVPSSAVKTQGDTTYVEVFNPPLATTAGTQGVVSTTPPQQQMVSVGASNDTSTEIISGLNEGDQVVTRTITASTVTTATQAPSLFGGGARAGATGAIRTGTGGATGR